MLHMKVTFDAEGSAWRLAPLRSPASLQSPLKHANPSSMCTAHPSACKLDLRACSLAEPAKNSRPCWLGEAAPTSLCPPPFPAGITLRSTWLPSQMPTPTQPSMKPLPLQNTPKRCFGQCSKILQSDASPHAPANGSPQVQANESHYESHYESPTM